MTRSGTMMIIYITATPAGPVLISLKSKPKREYCVTADGADGVGLLYGDSLKSKNLSMLNCIWIILWYSFDICLFRLEIYKTKE